MKPKILAFAGSTRKASYNKKLVKIAMAGAQEGGAEVTFLDLRDYPLPLFDQDDEEENDFPENALKLKRKLMDHDGFLISSPEYNSSISGVLKNAIDWASRRQEGEPALVCFKGKAAVLMSASPGALGGLRGLVSVRSMLGNIGVYLLPDQVALSDAANAFQEDGSLKDAKRQESILNLGRLLASFIRKLKS
ncbi:MAG: NAD(P)H-dependent oxidoreductase [Candidatus Omnitrophica bacterium]|nr:NAD(P)H-dependent oxidoreductase [Candidatus Omnitrophota bacterium]